LRWLAFGIVQYGFKSHRRTVVVNARPCGGFWRRFFCATPCAPVHDRIVPNGTQFTSVVGRCFVSRIDFAFAASKYSSNAHPRRAPDALTERETSPDTINADGAMQWALNCAAKAID
jgi:hypothetical protein